MDLGTKSIQPNSPSPQLVPDVCQPTVLSTDATTGHLSAFSTESATEEMSTAVSQPSALSADSTIIQMSTDVLKPLTFSTDGATGNISTDFSQPSVFSSTGPLTTGGSQPSAFTTDDITGQISTDVIHPSVFSRDGATAPSTDMDQLSAVSADNTGHTSTDVIQPSAVSTDDTTGQLSSQPTAISTDVTSDQMSTDVTHPMSLSTDATTEQMSTDVIDTDTRDPTPGHMSIDVNTDVSSTLCDLDLCEDSPSQMQTDSQQTECEMSEGEWKIVPCKKRKHVHTNTTKRHKDVPQSHSEEELENNSENQENINNINGNSSESVKESETSNERSGIKERYYDVASNYWSGVEATVNGMLGGLEVVSPLDIDGSTKFLNTLFKLSAAPGRVRSIDCGGGIGRVCKLLLTKYFSTVDLVDQDQQFINHAPKYINQSERMGEYICSGLQDFSPAPMRYNVIWCQWVLSHLPDDDLIRFLQRCRSGLLAGGCIVIKENVTRDSEDDFDEMDGSVTRSVSSFKKIVKRAGYSILLEGSQKQFPKNLFPVKMFAIFPRNKS